MIVKKMRLTNFKGVQSAEYDFSNRTKVNGQNGSGKSTIATAWFWLWADKDYELRSNPNIRPNGVEECIPRVEAVLDIDGAEVAVAKQQKRTVSKPNDKGISKITLANTYEINGVPKTERDFRSDLENRGIMFDKFLLLSHPEVFTGQKDPGRRKIIFETASEKSDLDIAMMSEETSAVAELLKSYKFDEVEAMHKASKKKAETQVKSIPDQIVGLEKAKIDIDVAELELKKSGIKEQIKEKETLYADGEKAIEELNKKKEELLQLQMEINAVECKANDELLAEKRRLRQLADIAQQKFRDAETEHKRAEDEIAILKGQADDYEGQRREYGEQYNQARQAVFDESAWVFDPESTICPNCGQEYPADKIEQIREEFETKKAKARADFENVKKARMDNIVSCGTAAKQVIEKVTAEIGELERKVEQYKKDKISANKEYSDVDSKLKALPEKPDLSGNREYVEMCLEFRQMEESMRNQSKASYHDSLKNEIEVLRQEISEVEKEIGKASNNVRIDEQISELRQKQREYEQAKADSERILYQLSLVSKKKNELLVEEINKNFGIVKWLLFDYQKNGEYKEVCIPTVDGRRFGDSTNTGREIVAKLDICNSLQKFFGIELPVFLDNAESINDFNIPEMDCQLILMNVTNGGLRVEVA